MNKEAIRKKIIERATADAKRLRVNCHLYSSEELNKLYIETFYEVLKSLPEHDIADLLIPAGNHQGMYRLSPDVNVDDLDIDYRWEAFVQPSPDFTQTVDNSQCCYGVSDLSMNVDTHHWCDAHHPNCLLLQIRLDPICREYGLALVTKESINRFFAEHGKIDKRYGPSPEEVRKKMAEKKRGALEEIGLMPVDGDRLLLPQDTKFKCYDQIKVMMQKAGGKYSQNAFVFKGKDAQEIKDRLLSGEKIDDKKKYQFFATPQRVRDRVIELARLTSHTEILEPSAGHGGLVDGVDKDLVTCFELWDENVEVLKEKGYTVEQGDFLEMDPTYPYDRIVANPPFTNNQDVDHVRHMHKWLKPDGILVSVMSTSWRHGTQKKHRDFREWLQHVEAKIETVKAGSFKESGTNIETCIVTIEGGSL